MSWSFAVDNAALQFLAEGQILTQAYTVTVADNNGGSVAQLVTITITGNQDAPTISAAVDTGAVEEDTLPTSASGTIDFADVDLTDTHTVSAAPAAGGYLGTFTPTITNASTGDGAGQVSWSFAVDNAALQFLAEGQILTQAYTVTVADNNGGSVAQLVTITVTGNQDAPTISAAVDTGAVEEDTLPTSASGTIDFADVDLTDTHTVSAAPAAGGYLGTFTPTITNASTGDGAGQVSWSFAVDNAALQFLAEGQILTQAYTVTVADNNGGSVDQLVTITVTGNQDAPTISAAVDTGAVEEDTLPTSASGTIDFADVDLTDTHTVSAAPAAGGYLGTFTPTITNASTGDGAGQVSWSFAVDNAALQFLAEGQILTQAYTVTVADNNGGSVAQLVTITITGNQDAPTISAAVDTGAVEEDTLPTSASGTIDFADVDLTDTHTVSAAPAAGGYLGTFTPTITNASTGDGAGQVSWSFAVDNAALQFLAEGQILTQTYTVTVADNNGGSVAQLVTITITGNQDAPTISAAVDTGAVEEDTLPTSASGTIDFADVDLTDTHTVSAAPAAGGYLGTFTPTITNASTGDGAGQVSWSFAVDNAALQFLAEGQTLTQTYTVTVADNNGGSVAQLVTITITGNQDAPDHQRGGRHRRRRGRRRCRPRPPAPSTSPTC